MNFKYWRRDSSHDNICKLKQINTTCTNLKSRVCSLSAPDSRVNVQKFHETELCPEHKRASKCLTNDRRAKGMNKVLTNAGTTTTTKRHTVSQASQTEWNGEEDAAVLYRRDRNLTPDNGLVPARDSLHCGPYVRARKAQNAPMLDTLLAVTDRSNFQ